MLFLKIFLAVLLFLIVLYLFAIMPSLRKHHDIKKLKGLYIAHRGFHSQYPENSIPSFEAANEKGFAIEIDIHLTKDGKIVVFHDDTLERMCGVDGGCEDKILSELKELRLANTDCEIPTLKECLETVAGKVPLLIEYKMVNGNYKKLCETANEILKDYEGQYFIQSFYPQVLMWYRQNRKDVCRGQLSSAFYKESFKQKLLGQMLFNFIARPDFVSYDVNFPKTFGRKLCKVFGALPVGWTIRSKDELEIAKKYFETYIFENFEP